jgi:lipid A 3-O-deacylase
MIRKMAACAAACLLFPALFLFAPAVYCVDAVALELGRGDDQTSIVRLAAQWQWRREWPAGQTWRIAGYWELSAAVWDNPDESTADIGLTPVFRVDRGTHSPYVEAAIGFHLVQARISAARVFSTAFQFGDHVGVGIRSGKHDIGVRLQHLSNGGIRRPNPGINFVLFRFQYNLD